MSTPINIDLIGKVVSFEVFPNLILTDNFNNLIVTGITTASQARKIRDVAALHVSVFPTLPPGTPNNYEAYPYLTFQRADGTAGVVGIPWINASTLLVRNGVTIQIKLRNRSLNDVDNVRKVLAANNLLDDNVEIETI